MNFHSYTVLTCFQTEFNKTIAAESCYVVVRVSFLFLIDRLALLLFFVLEVKMLLIMPLIQEMKGWVRRWGEAHMESVADSRHSGPSN